MPRQNFLSLESFVETTEIQSKQSLLSVPVFANSIQFVSENTKLHSFQFRYRLPKCAMEYCIDVSILTVNEQYTRVSFRGRYLNGQAFNEDEKMTNALKDFESAMLAAIKGDSSLYKPYQPKGKKPRKFQLTSLFTPFAVLFFLKKSS